MGLAATVYCNCYEQGLLRNAPPHPELVAIAHNGSLVCVGDQLEMLIAFDHWLDQEACKHSGGIALTHYLGNLAQLSLLREWLSGQQADLPLLLKKVIYNGTHTGDYLSLAHVPALQQELLSVAKTHLIDSHQELRNFHRQLQELSEVAMKLKKPIAF